MANDDTGKNVPAGASNQPPQAADPVEEARIIEEHVVAPPPQPAPPVNASVPEAPPSAPAPTPSPVPEPTASQESPPSDGAMRDDIAKILGDVKLPERHNQTPAPTPQKQYDTTLADPQREMPRVVPGFSPAPASADEHTASAPTDAKLGSLHTLKDDLQHVVQENKISYVRAVALEEEKRHRIEARAPIAPPSKRSLFTLFIIAILVGTGTLALGAVYVVMQQRTAQSNASMQSHILFAEQNVQFPVDNEAPADVRRTLASARNSGSLTLGAILQIIPVFTATDVGGQVHATSLTFGEFLAALGTRAPDELSRALSSDFFFGIHTVDENAPVIVVPVTSYERAFAAMLEWELSMNADLEPLFTQLAPQAIGADGVPVERVFEDTVMRNYDVRALKDDAGEIQLYYSFPTRNVLIIAESPYSFTEILSRLRADRRL